MSVIDLFGPTGRPVAGRPRRWSRSSRLRYVAAALAATFPVWPGIQHGEPIADEMLSVAEVALVVPVVLILPAAWALLGRSHPFGRRVGALLAGGVALWSAGTVTLADYATPSTVDDFLFWHLVTAGLLVGGAAFLEWRRRPFRLSVPRAAAGLALWALACAIALTVPVPDRMVPPSDAVLPLPSGIELRTDEVACHRFNEAEYCTRTMTVGSTGNDLARRLGRHLEQSKGWHLTWYDFAPTPSVECRPAGRLVNPYRLCLEVRDDARTTGLEIHLGYANPHDPVY
ncbi:hypothetical protein ACIA5D_15210 [Actinoplanes sp. NPDC051513]|uniref:hypothetical protein n=1 Tax=Actinoplanes sp. NPDC051513 TaxID=3363908 RepID=UPI0037AA6FC3